MSKTKKPPRTGFTYALEPGTPTPGGRETWNYAIYGPDGSLNCDGARMDSREGTEAMMKKMVKRLNTTAGFRATNWQKQSIMGQVSTAKMSRA